MLILDAASNVPTGILVRQQLNDRVRLVTQSSLPNVEFSGFLQNALADGTVEGRSLVVDDVNDPNDVPDATGHGIVTLRNVTVQGPFAHPPSPRVGDLVLEQRMRSLGFINTPKGVTFSTQYTVLEGRGGLSNVREGPVWASGLPLWRIRLIRSVPLTTGCN